MGKKYELTDIFWDITLDKRSVRLTRIRALKDFGDVKAGDLGGWVEKESNLSQEGDCWIYNESIVADNAVLSGNAKIHGITHVFGNAKVCDNVETTGVQIFIFGDAVVSGNARINGYIAICENANVSEDATVISAIGGVIHISGNVKVIGKSYLVGDFSLIGDTVVNGNITSVTSSKK